MSGLFSPVRAAAVSPVRGGGGDRDRPIRDADQGSSDEEERDGEGTHHVLLLLRYGECLL
jgi:hypothetical protein